MVVNDGCTVKGYLYGVVCGRFGILDAVADAEIIAVLSEEKEVSGESLARVSDAQELKRAVRRVQESDLASRPRALTRNDARED